MPRMKTRKVAENLVREILNTYNRLTDKNDFSKCEDTAQRVIQRVIADCADTARARLLKFMSELEDVPNE